ncbi:MAG: RraA family protein [Hyphomicrobiaceae bacterium]
MSDDFTTRLEECYTGIVHDVMRKLGFKDFTLPPRLRPIFPERTMAGPAFTILGKVDPMADPHETLLAWTGLLSKCPAGHIWVNQPNDNTVAHMGELSAETLRDKGVRGAVADGMIRDVNFLLELGFQTWCSGHTPRDIVGWWLPAATNVPIRIGDVDIEPGDYLIGDRDGLIRIPKGSVQEVIEGSEIAISTESDIRKAIKSGIDPQQAYLKFGKF